MFYGFDIYYFILIIPALLFGLWAQSQVNNNFSKYSQIETMRGMTGAQAAEYILRQNGIYDVNVVDAKGTQRHSYVKGRNGKYIFLSDGLYHSTSIAAIGVAAHEAAHAVQDKENYLLLRMKFMIEPASNVGSYLYFPLILLGIIFSSQYLVNLGIVVFSLTSIFLVIMTASEFDASDRAIKTLSASGILYGEEIDGAKKVLRAAALTYVAALVSSLAQLLRLILIFGGRRRD
jgi:Zn-dependent membrane protease YugP